MAYLCKAATPAEVEEKWNEVCRLHSDKNNEVWRAEFISYARNGQLVSYYGMLDGARICETTAMLDRNIVQNSEGLTDAQTAYLCAFHTQEACRGKGYFSSLFRFMLADLKQRGYTRVTLGVEPGETETLQIYRHLGFHTYLRSAMETYPDGTRIAVDYYGRDI